MKEYFLDDKELDLEEYPWVNDIEIRETAHIYMRLHTVRNLLNELVALREHVKRLQTRGTELVEENRDLKRRLSKAYKSIKDLHDLCD